MSINVGEMFVSIQKMANGLMERLPYIFIGLLVFFAFWFAGKGARAFARRMARKHEKRRNLGRVLGRVIQSALVLLGVLVALVIIIPSFQPAQLFQLLGIGSVAIGFAFKDILQNFLAGLLLLLQEPFRVNDQIVYKDFEGTVEDIQIRATTIKTYDSRRIVIPNAELYTNAVTVNTAYDKRRVECDFGIGYGDDIDEAKELIMGVLEGADGVLQEPAPDVIVTGLAESSVTLRARWWVEPPRRAHVNDTRDRIISDVKQTLISNGIDLPMPTHQVLFHDQTEETDGDRSRQREGWPAGRKAIPKPRRISDALAALRSEERSKRQMQPEENEIAEKPQPRRNVTPPPF